MWKLTRDDIHTSRGIGVSHLIDLHHLVTASEAARVWVRVKGIGGLEAAGWLGRISKDCLPT